MLSECLINAFQKRQNSLRISEILTQTIIPSLYFLATFLTTYMYICILLMCDGILVYCTFARRMCLDYFVCVISLLGISLYLP